MQDIVDHGFTTCIIEQTEITTEFVCRKRIDGKDEYCEGDMSDFPYLEETPRPAIRSRSRRNL